MMTKPNYIIDSQPHKQVPAKVTVYIDEGIKDLVELLNTFEGIQTFNSCQGYEGEMPYICFDYKDTCDPLKTFKFVEKLASAIGDIAIHKLGLRGHSIWLSLEWSGTMKVPCIVLRFSQKDTQDVVTILQKVRHQFV
jgi:hypothetical protein